MARIFLIVVIFLLSSFGAAQQKTEKPPQSPRQALIEMIRGGGAVIYKHLTVEMQQSMQKASTAYIAGAIAKAAPQQQDSTSTEEKNLPEPAAPQQEGPNSSDGNEGKTVSEVHTEIHADDNVGLVGFNLGFWDWSFSHDKSLQTFDSGPVLFTYADPSTKEKMEFRVETDDLRGDADDMQLSFHLFKDGQEQSIPLLQTFTVGLKMQEGVWRLNEISAEMKAAVGDPKFFEDMKKAFASEPRPAPTPATTQPKEEEPPAMPALSVVNMLAFAEDMYARSNPDAGFTCNLADLVGDKAGATFSAYLDPQIATGTYNGYRFSISGCVGRPSEIFHLVAEPVTAGGKAYCVNSTHVVRSSDDGRGSTCLAAGKAFNAE